MKRFLFAIAVSLLFGIALAPRMSFGQANLEEHNNALAEALPEQERAIYEEVKNLYSFLYAKVESEPTSDAIRATAESTGYSQSELAAIQQNSIEPLLRENRALSIEEANERLTKVRRVYNEILEMQQFEADMEAMVEPSELFSNGDTDDSGFDLLVDLHTMDLYLFGSEQSDLRPGGSGTFFATGGSSGSSSGGSGRTRTRASDSSPATGDEAPPPPSRVPTATTVLSSGGAPFESTGSILDSNQCFADSAFRQAVERFESLAGNGVSGRASGGISGTGTSGGDARSSGTADGGDGATVGAAPIEPPPPVEPAESSDWSIPKPCNDVFCFDIEYITRAASPYPDDENCIACHIQKMNDTMKEVTATALLPGKVTGNLLEPSFCKNALASGLPLSMNVQVLGQPIITPPNDDQLTKFDIGKEFGKLKEKMFGDRYSEPNEVNALDDLAVKRAANVFPDDTPILGIQEEVSRTVAISRLEANRDLARSAGGDAMADQGNYFQALEAELSNMKEYFTSMQNILHQMIEPTTTIEGYRYCS